MSNESYYDPNQEEKKLIKENPQSSDDQPEKICCEFSERRNYSKVLVFSLIYSINFFSAKVGILFWC